MTVHLRGVTWDHPRGLQSVVHASRERARLAPGVEVHWDARSLQGFADQPLASMTAEYDLLVIDHPHVPLAARAGLLLPLDGTGHDEELARQAAQSVGPSYRTYSDRGHQYGLAVDAAAQVAVHRPDLVADPPRTWDDVLELAADGRVLWPGKPVDAISSFMTIAANLGAPVVSKPGVFVDPAVGAEVLDLLHRVAAAVPASCLDQNPIQVAEALSTSDRWCYAPLLFGYTNYSREGFRPHRLAYVDMPHRGRGPVGSTLGGAGIAVSSATRFPREALDHAVWLATADVQRGAYFDGGGQPGNAVAWEDERLNASTLDFFTGTRATLEGSWVRPRSPAWLDVQDRAGTLVNAALRGEVDDGACLSRLQEVYERSLAEDEEAS